MGGNVNRTRHEIKQPRTQSGINRTRRIQFLVALPGERQITLPTFSDILGLSNNDPECHLRRQLLELPLQNDLTKVPETKVPAAIGYYDTAHTMKSRLLRSGHLIHSHSYSQAGITWISEEHARKRANLRLIRLPTVEKNSNVHWLAPWIKMLQLH